MTTETAAGGLVAEWREAMEGVTPGPWDVTTALLVRAIDGDDAIPLFESRTPWKKHRRATTAHRQEWSNAHFIARCSPDGISTLLGLIQQQAAELAEALTLVGSGAYEDAFKRPANVYHHALALAVEHFRKAEARATTAESSLAALRGENERLRGALVEAREEIIGMTRMRGFEGEGTDTDYVGFIDDALSPVEEGQGR